MKQLPILFVVGAQKSGTTSIHDWLSFHPCISLPTIKETHFFRDEEKFSKGKDWYLSWFDDVAADTVVGEVDPEYLFFPEAAQRILETNNIPKFVFIFREPIARAYSHYRMSVRRGFEELEFPEALNIETPRLQENDNRFSMIHHSYLSRGRYTEQVERFNKLFPASPKLYLNYDNLSSFEGCLEAYTSICKFIGVEPMPEEVNFEKRSNAASQPRSKLISDLVYKKFPLKRAIGRLIPSEKTKLKMAQLVDKLNQGPLKNEKSDWRDRVPNYIIKQSQEEALKLEKVTGLALSDWICP